MGIIGGLDVHRDYVDTETGEISRGRIAPANRLEVRNWLNRFQGNTGIFALEATTGWRFLVEELERAGLRARLAEPADTKALRGRKKRAKTDRVDARHLRELEQQDRIPQCWIPPVHIVELRTRLHLYKALSEERRAWVQRIKAQLLHQGVPPIPNLLTAEGQASLAKADLSPAGRQAVDIGMRMIELIDRKLDPIHREIVSFANHQAGCQALLPRYGLGPITSAAIVAMLGDARRFSSSRQAVRLTGLDITVYDSDGKRARGKLSRQGAPLLRWALFEGAQLAARKTSPDHPYYLKTRDRIGHNRTCLSVGRRTIRWSYHTLKALGDAAISAPVTKARRAS